MKACERYLNAINELVDGTLGPLRRSELELHLESCEGCQALVADLQRIAGTAASLPRLDPPDGVWMHIAGRLRAEGRVAAAEPQPDRRNYTLLALAAALVLAVGGSLYLLAVWNAADPATRIVATDAPAGVGAPAGQAPEAEAGDDGAAPANPALAQIQSVASELELSERHLERAVENASRSATSIDPDTVAVLQKNMLVMNQAIAESRKALETDPQNASVRQSLYETLRQKIQFLQDTIALMNEMRQGDAAGAAEIVEGKS